MAPSVLPTTVVLAQVLAAGVGADATPAALLPPRPRIAAVRAATPPFIDGRLDDRVWLTAAASDAFTQHYPDEGAPQRADRAAGSSTTTTTSTSASTASRRSPQSRAG